MSLYQACRWLAFNSDLVLLFFDPEKLDISDELAKVRKRQDEGGCVGWDCRASVWLLADWYPGLGAQKTYTWSQISTLTEMNMLR